MEENNVTTKVCGICQVEKAVTSFSIYGRKGFRRKMCKACVSRGLTMKNAPEPKETRHCPACDKTKPINHFYRNNHIPTGYEKRCKICHNNRVKIYKGESNSIKRKPHEQEWSNYFNIVGVTKNDYKSMFVFLNKIGYNLETDIHEQFCKKWGLPPNNPREEFKNAFTPKDFNLA